jgi:hypothetical protein
MNNSNNNADNQYLLNVPLAYLLQTRTINEIERDFDSNGWSVLHHAIAEADLNKINELIHFSFNWGVNGSSNFIPDFAYQSSEKRKTIRTRTLNRMPYCNGGYAPTHLAMYLYEYYSNLASDFFYQNVADNYKNILILLINQKTDWQSHIDSDGNSLFDHAFLSENTELIEMMQGLDPTFSNLKKINPSVGKKILEVMAIKNKGVLSNSVLAKLNDKISNINQTLDNKIMHDSLFSDLKVNNTKEKTIKKL